MLNIECTFQCSSVFFDKNHEKTCVLLVFLVLLTFRIDIQIDQRSLIEPSTKYNSFIAIASKICHYDLFVYTETVVYHNQCWI